MTMLLQEQDEVGTQERRGDVSRLMRASVVVYVGALLIAAYTGLRAPNRWSMTLYAPSLPDGFRRRFLVGTVLQPLASATDYDYWTLAGVAFAVLVAILAWLTVATLRTRLLSQRFLVIAWLLLPTGGYLFHEVGYLEQVLYLLLFTALWCLRGSRWQLASALMVAAACCHEIALLTVLPIFACYAFVRLAPRKAVYALAAPILCNAVLLALPATSDSSVRQLIDKLNGANFAPRTDALKLITQTPTEAWRAYDVGDVWPRLAALAVIAGVGLVVFIISGRHMLPGVHAEGGRLHLRDERVLKTAAAVAAAIAPALLAFGGHDESRWAFLLITNFFIVLWLLLDESGREMNVVQVGWLTITFLVATHIPLLYFDLYTPRDLTPNAVSDFIEQLWDGELLTIPRTWY